MPAHDDTSRAPHASVEAPSDAADAVVAATRHWLTRAVIGLNLCPFAKAVHAKGQIRYVVCGVRDLEGMLTVLETELRALKEADPESIDTTLLIFPQAFADFLAFNDALFFAERLLGQLRLDGELQIASFHPQYQFDGTEPDDIENYTNRAPYPILHLLRESSVERATQAFPDAADIYERNQETMRQLGHDGWREWMQELTPPSDAANASGPRGIADCAADRTAAPRVRATKPR